MIIISHNIFRLLATGLIALSIGSIAEASESLIVNPAPQFAGGSEAGRSITLKSLRGKAVVLLMAPSPKDRAFRVQLNSLKGSYERLAAQGTIFFAAFSTSNGRIPSNRPFVLVNDPSATTAAYDVRNGFAIAVIGRDGNLDCISAKPLPGQRILDLIMNNAQIQTLLRR